MKVLNRLYFAAFSVFLIVALSASVLAQTNQTGSGLSISPLHTKMSLNPGQGEKISITLKNITSGSIVAKAFVNDFVSDNKTGNPVIITDPAKRTLTSIRDFVIGPENVPLAKGEQKKITVNIHVPGNASPGGYYGILRYQAVPVDQQLNEGQVSLSASVGTIVLVEVKGDIVQKMQLLALHIYSGGREGSLFYSKPNQVGVELKNLGNTFTQPFGRVVVENMSGKQVNSYELNRVDPRANVLPGTKRIFRDKINGVKSPGRYTVTASVSYGSGSDVLVSQKTFWYVPAWLIAAIVAGLILLILAAILAYRRYRRSRRGLSRRR